MSDTRYFMDTAFILALLNKKDSYHQAAKALFADIKKAHEVWLHDGILIEVGNGLAYLDRKGVAHFIERIYHTKNMRCVSLDRDLLPEG